MNMTNEEILRVLAAMEDKFTHDGFWDVSLRQMQEARALIESALLDQARYRFLRDVAHPDDDESGIAVMCMDWNDRGKPYHKHFCGQALDDAIDTARLGGEKV